MAYSTPTAVQVAETSRDVAAGTTPRHRQTLTEYSGVHTYSTGDSGSDTNLDELELRVGEIVAILRDRGLCNQPQLYFLPKKSAARLKAEKAALSREDVIIGLKDAIVEAKERGNMNAVISGLEKLGKTLAMFTDVSLQEHRFQEMTPEKFAAELDELIEDDLIREHIRVKLEAYDTRRYGGPAPPSRGGVAGGAGPASGSVQAQAASAPVLRGRVH